jgi:hypothetical protein
MGMKRKHEVEVSVFVLSRSSASIAARYAMSCELDETLAIYMSGKVYAERAGRSKLRSHRGVWGLGVSVEVERGLVRLMPGHGRALSAPSGVPCTSVRVMLTASTMHRCSSTSHVRVRAFCCRT